MAKFKLFHKIYNFFTSTHTRLRTSVAIAMLLFVYGIFKACGNIGISGIVLIISGFMLYEYYKMFNKNIDGKFFINLISIVGTLTAFLINRFIPFTPNYILILIFPVLFCISLIQNIINDKKHWILESLAPLYIGLSMVSILYICLYSNNLIFLLYAFVITIASDTGAYFTGRALQGPKLCPSISPSKTISGALGGIFCAFTFGTSLIIYFMWTKSTEISVFNTINFWGFLSIALSITSIIGDLFESWIKRKVGIKDSSNLIPGHGGFLDRFDSILFVAPIIALILAWVMPAL